MSERINIILECFSGGLHSKEDFLREFREIAQEAPSSFQIHTLDTHKLWKLYQEQEQYYGQVEDFYHSPGKF